MKNKLIKIKKGVGLALKEKKWKRKNRPSGEMLLFFVCLLSFFKVVPPESVLVKFSKKQRDFFKKRGITSGYILAFWVLQTWNESEKLGEFLKKLFGENAERAAGYLAAYNQQAGRIQGTAAVLRFFASSLFKCAKVVPGWGSIALTAAYLLLPVVESQIRKKDKSVIMQELPSISENLRRRQIEEDERKMKPPLAPPTPPPASPSWSKQAKKAVPWAAAGMTYGFVKEFGALILIGAGICIASNLFND